jgi:ABC-type transporter lipoprotein component MlaA
VYIFDWRYVSSASFNILSKLCQLSNSTVYDAIDGFEEQVFVSNRLLDENIFIDNWKSIVNEFIQSTETDFGETINMLRMLNHADQLISERGINGLAVPKKQNEV